MPDSASQYPSSTALWLLVLCDLWLVIGLCFLRRHGPNQYHLWETYEILEQQAKISVAIMWSIWLGLATESPVRRWLRVLLIAIGLMFAAEWAISYQWQDAMWSKVILFAAAPLFLIRPWIRLHRMGAGCGEMPARQQISLSNLLLLLTLGCLWAVLICEVNVRWLLAYDWSRTQFDVGFTIRHHLWDNGLDPAWFGLLLALPATLLLLGQWRAAIRVPVALLAVILPFVIRIGWVVVRAPWIQNEWTYWIPYVWCPWIGAWICIIFSHAICWRLLGWRWIWVRRRAKGDP